MDTTFSSEDLAFQKEVRDFIANNYPQSLRDSIAEKKINNEELIESKGFSTIISNLFTDCDVFEPDPSLREDYEISEVELKNRVKKTLLEIKYRYP